LYSTKSGLLLNTYSVADVEKDLREFRIHDVLAGYGFKHLSVKIDASDLYVHHLIITDESLAGKKHGHDFLIDMFVRRRDIRVEETKAYSAPPDVPLLSSGVTAEQARSFMKNKLGSTPIKLTYLEWIRMQDPTRDFTQKRPQLPDQLHPGLGAGRYVYFWLHSRVVRIKRDALAGYPDHFYDAYMYAVYSGMKYINPLTEGLFRALLQVVQPAIDKYGLAVVSWAIFQHKLEDKGTGKPFIWHNTQEQVDPCSARMQQYFDDSYDELVAQYTQVYTGRFEFGVDLASPEVQPPSLSLAQRLESKAARPGAHKLQREAETSLYNSPLFSSTSTNAKQQDAGTTSDAPVSTHSTSNNTGTNSTVRSKM
jgi:hypothetical protein